MFSLSDLRRYLAHCKEQLANAVYDDQKRFYTKAIVKTMQDIEQAIAEKRRNGINY